MARESHLRSLLKGISWRFIATGTLMAIVYLVTGSIENAIAIGATEFIVKLFIYYAHERGWAYYLKDKEQTKKISLYKTLVWRVIASTTSLSVIIWTQWKGGDALSSTFAGAGLIVTIEFFAKFVIYYLHERAWQVLPLGTIRNFFRIKKRKKTSS